jgi:hypothetical protein
LLRSVSSLTASLSGRRVATTRRCRSSNCFCGKLTLRRADCGLRGQRLHRPREEVERSGSRRKGKQLAARGGHRYRRHDVLLQRKRARPTKSAGPSWSTSAIERRDQCPAPLPGPGTCQCSSVLSFDQIAHDCSPFSLHHELSSRLIAAFQNSNSNVRSTPADEMPQQHIAQSTRR